MSEDGSSDFSLNNDADYESFRDQNINHDDINEGDFIGVDNEMQYDNNLNSELGPTTGMRFSSIDELFDFYQDHAKFKGFGVVKRSLCKKGSEVIKYALLTCDKGGKSINTKNSKKSSCRARVNAVLDDDKRWRVTKVISEHSHELFPDMSRIMPAHRHVLDQLKRTLDANDRAGRRICKNRKLVQVQSGGPDEMDCLAQDCRNFFPCSRRLILQDGDAESLQKFIREMQRKERGFFHQMDLCHDGMLRNIIWIHPQSKAAYEDFHDVISFDTTYLVNRYKMPLTSFVGVNHHGQSILLGCALVSGEDVGTFRWLFETWISAMGDIHPHYILTDQCENIRAAINEVMPDTTHRFCIWHIYTKLPTKLRGVSDYNAAKKEFKATVQESLTMVEFETRWAQFLNNHGLNENEWLCKLFDERERWVPVYLRHLFLAGMKSTQRSEGEGMHGYFDGLVNSSTTLKNFVEQYELALIARHETELKEEFKSKYTNAKCETGFLWEEQLERVLTRNIFKLVHKELLKFYQCHLSVPVDDRGNPTPNQPGVETFKIEDNSIRNDYYRNAFVFTVDYRPMGQYLDCSCKLFESIGVICCHIMKVLAHKRIDELDKRYIKGRWRKDVYRPYLSKFFKGGYPKMSIEYQKYKELLGYFDHVADIAVNSDAKMEYMKEKLTELKNDLLNWNNNAKAGPCTGNPTVVSTEGGPTIHNPQVAQPRGRPHEN